MTSILKVSEIQDPTNSNTAISIDAAGKVTAGNLTSPGHVVQVVEAVQPSQVVISSTYPTFTTIITGSITPKFSGSKFIISAVLPNYSNNPNGGAWTNSIYIRLYEQEGGGSDSAIAGYEHPGPITSMEFSQVIPVLYATGTKSTIQSYTYSIKGTPTVSGDTHYFGRNTGALNAFSRIVIMEIAQ
jgi:hypothetical protein